MNAPTLATDSLPATLRAARHAYEWGNELQAVRLYRESAEQEKERRNIAGEMEARRWTGNSLMWSGQHQEALRVLLEVGMCDHPQADPGSVFGAKTDCIMIVLFHAPAVVCQKILDEARTHLERIGKPHWRHRLELESSILYFRQGRLQAAADAAVQAFRLRQATSDGPLYADFAHLKWITRPLFLLRQEKLLAEWAQSAERVPITMLSDRNRLSCIRLLVARLRRASGREPHGMLEEARASATNVELLRYGWDELFEVARGLMLAADLAALDRLPLNQPCALPVVQATFAVEREINLIRHRLGLPMWDAELNWPPESPDTLPTTANISPSVVEKMERALTELALAALAEDQRMETTAYSEVGLHQRIEEARNIMEGARSLRPEALTTLLKNCQRVKVARLCVRWAEELNLQWAAAAKKAAVHRLGHGRWTARLKDGTILVLKP